MNYICPVCGYPDLEEPPYDEDGNPSYNICDCCGYEFGFDDSNEGTDFAEYRKGWIKKGANWFTVNRKPSNWNLEMQLKNLEESSKKK